MFRRNLSVSGYRALVTWQPSPVLAVILYYNGHSWKFSHRSRATIGILPWRTPIKFTLLNVVLVRAGSVTIFAKFSRGMSDVHFLTMQFFSILTMQFLRTLKMISWDWWMRRWADSSCQCPVTIVTWHRGPVLPAKDFIALAPHPRDEEMPDLILNLFLIGLKSQQAWLH